MKKIKEKSGLVVVLYRNVLDCLSADDGPKRSLELKVKLYRMGVYRKRFLFAFGCEEFRLIDLNEYAQLGLLNVNLLELQEAISNYNSDSKPLRHLGIEGEYSLRGKELYETKHETEKVTFYLYDNKPGKVN